MAGSCFIYLCRRCRGEERVALDSIHGGAAEVMGEILTQVRYGCSINLFSSHDCPLIGGYGLMDFIGIEEVRDGDEDETEAQARA